MGNLLSPVLANIFMCKLEEDVVTPLAPHFYDRYVDDCFKNLVVNWDLVKNLVVNWELEI
mgnify:CR=1 FL=1